ncbi:uncharacterized protein LOC132793408 [Drosophila nasuta]|uniref:uncharacterized protein LOC132793408 n=1 Tax=Drosophila nasuta TaxID=42062 RepID=UPI00295EE6E9|nr:uncharacterized protein LOC132793408 [Drosophila nasuta]
MQIGFLLSVFLAVLCICHGKDIIKDCQEEYEVTEAEVDPISKKAPIESLSLILKCYAKCTIAHLLGDDGKLAVERVDKQKGLKCRKRYDNLVITNEEVFCDYGAKILYCLNE